MEVNGIKLGQIFIFGPTLTRPQLKLKVGFLDMISRYIYSCWGNEPATVLTGTQIYRLRSNWGMTEEKFEEFKRALIEIYSK